jgi:hypothetical protein
MSLGGGGLLDPMLSQMTATHTLTSHVFQMHFNIILPPSSAEIMNKWSYTFTPLICFYGVDRDNISFAFTPTYPKWSVSFKFSDLNAIHIYSVTYFIRATCFSHVIRHRFGNLIMFGGE